MEEKAATTINPDCKELIRGVEKIIKETGLHCVPCGGVPAGEGGPRSGVTSKEVSGAQKLLRESQILEKEFVTADVALPQVEHSVPERVGRQDQYT
jgi:hypothetical protein